MSVSHHRSNDASNTVTICGRRHPFIRRERLGRREYYLLKRIGSPFRERYLAFDPRQGPGGNFFLIQVWPHGAATQQQLRVFKRLKDDSLPRVVEWEVREGSVVVAMTWMEGITLAEYMENIRSGRRPPVAIHDAVRLFRGLASAVCTLSHKHQIAHGDIQPPNVVITDHPSRLVLIDFGSAWTSESAAYRQEGDGLHRCYAAPELQGTVKPVGFFADQFSVSVLFYQLITGELPYGGLGGKAGRPEYVARAKDSLVAPSKMSSKCRDLPRSLQEGIDRVVMRGLALDPSERYPDRHAWQNDLFEVYARFRLAPELPTAERLLTRVIHWFVKPK